MVGCSRVEFPRYNTKHTGTCLQRIFRTEQSGRTRNKEEKEFIDREAGESKRLRTEKPDKIKSWQGREVIERGAEESFSEIRSSINNAVKEIDGDRGR